MLFMICPERSIAQWSPNQHMDQSTSHDSTTQMSLLQTGLPNHHQLNTFG